MSSFSSDPRHHLGRQGEQLAEDYLRAQRYRVRERRYRTREGEVDLVVEHQGILVFVEVKTRSSSTFGSGFEAVDARKLCRLYRVAHHYMRVYNWCGAWRVDVIALTLNGHGKLSALEHLHDVPP